MRDAARLPPPLSFHWSPPCLQLIVSTRNSRPSFFVSFLSEGITTCTTASAPISFVRPDNPRTHDRLGATRDAPIPSSTRCFRRRRPTCRPDPSRLDRDTGQCWWSNGASLQAPAPCIRPTDRRAALRGAEPGSWTRFLFCIDACHRRRRFRTFFPPRPALRATLSASTDFQARTFRSLLASISLTLPMSITEPRTQPLSDDDEDQAGGDKQRSILAVVKAIVEI
jgi:hypothetical protein